MTDEPLQPIPTALVRLNGDEQHALRNVTELVRALAPDAPEWLEDAEALEAVVARVDDAVKWQHHRKVRR